MPHWQGPEPTAWGRMTRPSGLGPRRGRPREQSLPTAVSQPEAGASVASGPRFAAARSQDCRGLLAAPGTRSALVSRPLPYRRVLSSSASRDFCCLSF